MRKGRIELRKLASWASSAPAPCLWRAMVWSVVLVNGVAVRAQVTVRASVDSAGSEGTGESRWSSISSDGRFVAFLSGAPNLIGNDANGAWDVFVRDRRTGVTECVSVDPNGAPGNGNSGWFPGPRPAISADGRFVAFVSDATNLIVGGTKHRGQVFVRDRSAGVTELASVNASGEDGDDGSYSVSISADGKQIAFDSAASNLVTGDTNGFVDVFVRDRSAGSTARASVDSFGAQADGDCFDAAISEDGSVVAFDSNATNLVANDMNFTWDVFVHTRATGITERVSVDSLGAESYGASSLPAVSADGMTVAFSSWGQSLVPNDSNGVADVFVRDRLTGVTERASVDSSGLESNAESGGPTLAADGLRVAFHSEASNLVAGDSNLVTDIFVHDRNDGSTSRASLESGGYEADQGSEFPSLSADGRSIAFDSQATNLVSGDTNGQLDIFVRDEHWAVWTNYGSGFPGTNGIPTFTSQQDPVVGTSITVDVSNSYGSPTVGLLLAGFARADTHTNRGGDLLVVASIVVPITFAWGGDSFGWAIPSDADLAGLTVDAQVIELDPGAVFGFSFTRGLELIVGF